MQCVACNTMDPNGLCPACSVHAPRVGNPCRQCGASIGLPGGYPVCGRCRRHPPAYDLTVVPFRYAPPLSGVIHRFKYRGRVSNAKPLAKIFSMETATRHNPRPQLLIPVPLHWTRLIKRGFNQSVELCRHLSAELDIPFDRSAVYRTRRTPPQVELPLSRRRRNVKDCFGLRRQLHVDSVAIVDDVMTSGETMNQMASLLKKHGVTNVQSWAICYVFLSFRPSDLKYPGVRQDLIRNIPL
jgi:ComF family protein